MCLCLVEYGKGILKMSKKMLKKISTVSLAGKQVFFEQMNLKQVRRKKHQTYHEKLVLLLKKVFVLVQKLV